MGVLNSSTRNISVASGNTSGRCLLIGLDPVQLIVPRILVAEIIHSEGVEISSSLNRHVRIFEWRGYQVPLLSSAIINPQCRDSAGEALKFIIFHGLFNRARLPYYAIAVSRNPRIVVASFENITERSDVALQPSELMAVTVDAESAVIPRVDYLEKYVIENCYR